jgi:deoxyribodipyrimidine photo-lyase
LKNTCPIQGFPDEIESHQLDRDPLFDHDLDPEKTAGPSTAVKSGSPKYVLLTIDSLGDQDPALVANPELPAIFVFNETALNKLQLSSRRIGFYLQTLQDLATRRDLQVTFAPVPSFQKFEKLAEIYPYQWLRRPHSGSVRSFSSWRQKLS